MRKAAWLIAVAAAAGPLVGCVVMTDPWRFDIVPFAEADEGEGGAPGPGAPVAASAGATLVSDGPREGAKGTGSLPEGRGGFPPAGGFTGPVTITSYPAGARVFIDGEERGATPLAVRTTTWPWRRTLLELDHPDCRRLVTCLRRKGIAWSGEPAHAPVRKQHFTLVRLSGAELRAKRLSAKRLGEKRLGAKREAASLPPVTPVVAPIVAAVVPPGVERTVAAVAGKGAPPPAGATGEIASASREPSPLQMTEKPRAPSAAEELARAAGEDLTRLARAVDDDIEALRREVGGKAERSSVEELGTELRREVGELARRTEELGRKAGTLAGRGELASAREEIETLRGEVGELRSEVLAELRRLPRGRRGAPSPGEEARLPRRTERPARGAGTVWGASDSDLAAIRRTPSYGIEAPPPPAGPGGSRPGGRARETLCSVRFLPVASGAARTESWAGVSEQEAENMYRVDFSLGRKVGRSLVHVDFGTGSLSTWDRANDVHFDRECSFLGFRVGGPADSTPRPGGNVRAHLAFGNVRVLMHEPAFLWNDGLYVGVELECDLGERASLVLSCRRHRSTGYEPYDPAIGELDEEIDTFSAGLAVSF